jgi:mRNA-degrading endonuclease RelE of RelBE toxin-antitoxin system
MNSVLWTRTAGKQLEKIPLNHKKQILAGVDLLVSTWPNSTNVKDLKDMPGYRLRVGIYRIFFVTDENGELCVLKITQVRKRDDRTYKH